MHAQGCPKNNNLYADCECAAIDQHNHTTALLNHAEALRKHDEAASELEALQRQLAESHAKQNEMALLSIPTTEEAVRWEEMRQEVESLRAQNRELEKQLQAALNHAILNKALAQPEKPNANG